MTTKNELTASPNRELYEYKQKVISYLINSEKFVEGLNADVEASELMYNNILPYGVIAPTQVEAKSIVTVEILVPQIFEGNDIFKNVVIAVTVIVHNDLIRTDYGIPRHDYIAAQVSDLLNGNSEFGYGVLELSSSTEGAFSERHTSRTMRFTTKEINRPNYCY